MDVRLSPQQQAIRARLEEVFNERLAPGIRRMGERPHGATGATGGGGEALSDAAAGARKLVWESLAETGALRLPVPERLGGLGLGQGVLVTVAELLGRALYQSPFFDTVTATELLLETGGEAAHGRLLERMAGGGCPVAVAARADGAASPAVPGPLTVDRDGDRQVVTARRRFVPFAPEVEQLLVVGTTAAGVGLALAARDQEGVIIRRHDDLARGDLYAVRLDRARVAAGGWAGTGEPVARAWERALSNARTRHAGYLVGLCQGALDLTVAHAKQRKQFGQPVARFQSVAFRLAALATRTEAVRHLTYLSACEADHRQDARLTATEALLLAGDLAREATAEAVQIHGAFGMSDQCDAQIFFRRAALDAMWLGTPAQLRCEAAGHLVRHLATAPADHAA